jgi:hypothetical protein
MTGAARTTVRQLVAACRDVAVDLPLLLAAPLIRHRHLRWGATPEEVASALPGDGLHRDAQFVATRAVTIGAPPDAVWPWIVQVGSRRAGWYSNDLLDNLGRPSATTIVPELQGLEVGQWVPMSPFGTPSERTAFRVDSFDTGRWLLWTKPDSSWAWSLSPVDGGRTRLVSRVHAVYDWEHPVSALAGIVLLEFGDFAMMRRMLLGIKSRAESAVDRHRAPGVREDARTAVDDPTAPDAPDGRPDAMERPEGRSIHTSSSRSVPDRSRQPSAGASVGAASATGCAGAASAGAASAAGAASVTASVGAAAGAPSAPSAPSGPCSAT